MAVSSLKERMSQVEHWLGSVATRPLVEDDYELARTAPENWKRVFDGQTFGATYLARHARRNLKRGQIAKGVAQALPAPFLGTAAVILFPISTCCSQRREQKNVRSEDATRENSIAFELRNARRVANTLARDDQVQMLKTVYGMSRRDVAAWACVCLSLICKTLRDVEEGDDRIRNSGLIRHHAARAILAVYGVGERYEHNQPCSSKNH